MKPPTFDGKTSWTNYLKQFDAAARANGWSSQQKALSLTVALRGEALDVLQSLTPDEADNFELLVNRLEMRYGQTHLQPVYRMQLKSRKQKNGETIQEFEAEVARMVRLAYSNAAEDFLECLAIQTFTDGLRDVELQRAVRLARPKSLVDALTIALEFDAATEASRGVARLREVTGNCDHAVHSVSDVEAVVERLMKLSPKRRRPVRCWNCGELGHVRNTCPQKEKSSAEVPQQQEN
jgi:hypothetical protein